jgi:hypothetical protein
VSHEPAFACVKSRAWTGASAYHMIVCSKSSGQIWLKKGPYDRQSVDEKVVYQFAFFHAGMTKNKALKKPTVDAVSTELSAELPAEQKTTTYKRPSVVSWRDFPSVYIDDAGPNLPESLLHFCRATHGPMMWWCRFKNAPHIVGELLTSTCLRRILSVPDNPKIRI